MARPLKNSDNDKTLIKQIMREKGVTIEELAVKMGKAKTTVSIQLNNSNMTIDTLTAIANALEVEISDLFPVPEGYVHWLELKNHLINAKVKTPDVSMDDKEMALFKKFKEFLSTQESIV